MYYLYDETDLVTTIKITRLRWAGHIVRMQIIYHARKSPWTSQKTEEKASRKAKPQMDGWSDEGCRDVGSQELKD